MPLLHRPITATAALCAFMSLDSPLVAAAKPSNDRLAASLNIDSLVSRLHQSHHQRRLLPASQNSRRFLDTNTTATTCSKDPFLWLIQKEGSSNNDTEAEVVGYAVGSMHLPREFLLDDTAWNSLSAAAADSCAIYGEIDVTDVKVVKKLASNCAMPVESTEIATLSDIPDTTLRDEYAAIMLNISIAYGPPDDLEADQRLADAFMENVAVKVGMEMIYAYNTPGYKEVYFEALFAPVAVDNIAPSLDRDLLSLGRPSGSLETVNESCQFLNELSLQTEDFLADYEELYAERLRHRLTLSYTPWIESYACGDTQHILDMIHDPLFRVPQELVDDLLEGKLAQEWNMDVSLKLSFI